MKNNTIKIKAFLCLLLLTCGWISVQAQQVLTVKGVVVDALKRTVARSQRSGGRNVYRYGD